MKFDYGIIELCVINLTEKSNNGGELWKLVNLF
jgi:hypothetical protein